VAIVAAAIAAGSVGLAVSAGLWALAEQFEARRLRRTRFAGQMPVRALLPAPATRSSPPAAKQ
jgi:hypothetical protein